MWYVINVGTGKPNCKYAWMPSKYQSESVAKAVCTKLNKKYGNTTQWKVMSVADYVAANPVKMVERTNLMSGQKFTEPEDTPNFCSPASETYWSM